MELRDLQRGIFEYGEMMKQLRQKMQTIDFKKHKERLYSEKLSMINLGKKEDLVNLNKENMQISYEIDELMDRINAKKAALVKESPRFFVTDEKAGMSKDSSKKAIPPVMSAAGQRVDNAFPLLELNRVQKLPQDQQEDLMYFVQHIDRLEKDFKRLRSDHYKVGA